MIFKTRSIPALVLVATLVGIVAMALAQNSTPVPSVQADAEGVATLSSSNASPVVDRAWVYSDTPWETSDHNRVLYFSSTNDDFDSVAAEYTGTEVAKTLDCRVTTICSASIIEIKTPDGKVYEIEHDAANVAVGDVCTVNFLLTE